MRKRKFIFDVDGTLTPSRGLIDPEFKKFFNEFCLNNPVYLITGSDRPKTIEQIGEDTYNLCHTVYNCSGNDVWQGNNRVRTNNWTLPELAHEWLSKQLAESTFPLRTGLHFEHRKGMVNFSIVGRNADATDRKKYVAWDEEHLERVWIADKFNLIFPELQATVGGETGIDIAPKGCDKSQVIKDFDKKDIIYFFGDKMEEGGNDYPLAQVVTNAVPVTDWQHTWDILNHIILQVGFEESF
jgi:phosphomannomutase